MVKIGARSARPLERSRVTRIVREASQRAGITAPVSTHWLRHAHAGTCTRDKASRARDTSPLSDVAITSRSCCYLRSALIFKCLDWLSDWREKFVKRVVDVASRAILTS